MFGRKKNDRQKNKKTSTRIRSIVIELGKKIIQAEKNIQKKKTKTNGRQLNIHLTKEKRKMFISAQGKKEKMINEYDINHIKMNKEHCSTHIQFYLLELGFN